MALRHLLLRLTPRLDRRWLIALLVIGALAAAASFFRWGPAPPPLELVALGPEGRFQDTLRIPASWGDTATVTPGAVVRAPLILGVRNPGRRPARPESLSLSLPVRYRLTGEAGQELHADAAPGSPLSTYTIRTGLGPVEPGRLPALLSAHDTLWLEVIIPRYYCVAVAESIPEFVPAPPPPVETLRDLRIFYSLAGGDLSERRTGTLAIRLDTSLLQVELPEQPPTFPMEVDRQAANPELGPLQRVGSRRIQCGEPEAPMELLSTVWETPDGARMIALDYGGTVRKRLYDLDGDGVVERESWNPTGEGFVATRRARLPIPELLLPPPSPGRYDMARFDTLPPDSLARLDPFREAMPGPGTLPPPGDSLAVRPGTRTPGRTDAPGSEQLPLDSLPEPTIEPAPLGRPVPTRPDTGGG